MEAAGLNRSSSERESGLIGPFPLEVVKYGIDGDEADRFGLPCGGTLELLIENDPDATLQRVVAASLADRFVSRRSARLIGLAGQCPIRMLPATSLSWTPNLSTRVALA
jgi:xanthine/CO dehydrogenase XdhC/CoxF family maturation factor